MGGRSATLGRLHFPCRGVTSNRIFIKLCRGPDAASAVPFLALSDPEIVAVVGRAIARQLGVEPSAVLPDPPFREPRKGTSADP